jgi:hypothetical protein
MSTTEILSLIDAEISRLEQARAILATIAKSQYTSNTALKTRKKRTMSLEGRARVADAQRKRWAKLKKAAK